MSKLPPVLQNLSLPVIASPLFIISNPKLVIAQCKAGIEPPTPALHCSSTSLGFLMMHSGDAIPGSERLCNTGSSLDLATTFRNI